MEICVNRIIAEALFDCGYKSTKETLSDDGINPSYLEVVVDGSLTETGIKRIKECVLSNSNNDKETWKELESFLSSLPDEQSLRSNPVVVFWNED